jgi:hypothetical protein
VSKQTCIAGGDRRQYGQGVTDYKAQEAASKRLFDLVAAEEAP